MATNEELAMQIQSGDRDKLPELWTQVERFAAMQAGRRARALGGFGGVTAEDLYQSGYIALVSAVETYDPAAGQSFIGWFAFHLKTAFAEAGNYRSRKQARDPLHRAGSMDAPMSEDGDTTVGELIEDPGAAEDFQNAEHRLYLEQLHNALDAALGQLPEQESDILRQRFYQDRSLREIAAAENVFPETVRQWQDKGLRRLRHPRISRELLQFVEERTPYYGHWSAQSGECTVEMIVIRREGLAGNR